MFANQSSKIEKPIVVNEHSKENVTTIKAVG